MKELSAVTVDHIEVSNSVSVLSSLPLHFSANMSAQGPLITRSGPAITQTAIIDVPFSTVSSSSNFLLRFLDYYYRHYHYHSTSSSFFSSLLSPTSSPSLSSSSRVFIDCLFHFSSICISDLCFLSFMRSLSLSLSFSSLISLSHLSLPHPSSTVKVHHMKKFSFYRPPNHTVGVVDASAAFPPPGKGFSQANSGFSSLSFIFLFLLLSSFYHLHLSHFW